MARKRVWTESERQRHSEACRSKDRLTDAQRLEIVKLAETGRTERGERFTQAQISVLFNKVWDQFALFASLPALFASCQQSESHHCYGQELVHALAKALGLVS